MLVDPTILDSLSEQTIGEILQSWIAFVSCTEILLGGSGDLSAASELASSVTILCRNGLRSLLEDHFLQYLEDTFMARAVLKFWRHFDKYSDVLRLDLQNQILVDQLHEELCSSLEEMCSEKNYQEKCLVMLIHALQLYEESIATGKINSGHYESNLLSRYQLMVSSVLLTTLPSHFPEVLRLYFKHKLEELNTMIAVNYKDGMESLNNDRNLKYNVPDEMNIDGSHPESAVSKNYTLVKCIGKVVLDLRNLGFTALTEDAYASSIIQLLKAKVQNLAVDDYRTPVLQSIKEWIQAVPLQFLHALLCYLGDSFDNDVSSGPISPLASRPLSYPGIDAPSEGLVRWQLRLEYFAYEKLQDLRIGKLFEIIVDYPDSSPAIEDLKQCLEYTGQHSKLVDSFISSLRYRLLTAGASTNDILHQYVSTIKALRTIGPTGVFLEAVGEPIRDYLRGRKDTIKCIVTMLTDGSGINPSGMGNTGDSLLEELNREAENQETADTDDDINVDDKQAWINAERWEPDPIEADPLRGSRQRGKIDILEMLVSIIGSKDQLVNEYRVMLAEKLLNKSDYDIDSEIRTLELLKIHFGESSMQKCEIMVNDLISSKRMNANIKASKSQLAMNGSEQGESMSLDLVDATIISSNFWPPIQEESLHLPLPVQQLLSDYAERFHEIKTPRKLLWKKYLGIVKLELHFDDRNVEFSVTPLHAAIIMQFQEKTSWASKSLAAAVGLPVDILNRRMSFWMSKGVITDTGGADSSERVFTLVDDLTDTNRNGISNETEGMDEEGESSVASVEEQLQKEMTIYQKFIEGMLTNFGGMPLDRIHNTLKMFCVAEPTYDKSLQELQSFLSVLRAEEKLDLRDGHYYLKK
ncbi:anaphase-promoting complex subunit 2 isoform X2 [Dendrobium catenatum]|uniref:Anaphase-promoting complex subunit 2 n=1 Tax=Dendrobium catenatum TaxID=906689 RepID=A0A2I0VBR8_9ASPA|nr:anaphase-promoting complex subunit 2 isoform X2 [Dendrobium catenatum]PKU60855.1 Anaphase-promoting complex subunit 2 [Dendrobium catenatum]